MSLREQFDCWVVIRARVRSHTHSFVAVDKTLVRILTVVSQATHVGQSAVRHGGDV